MDICRVLQMTKTVAVEFKEVNPLEKRKEWSQKIREGYPDRIPLIVQKNPNAKTIPDIEKTKFLVPCDISVSELLLEIRRHLEGDHLGKDQALYLFVAGSILPPTGAILSTLYDKHADEDGFLYIIYTGENTFGCAKR